MNEKIKFSDPRDRGRRERISLAYGDLKEVPKKIATKYGDEITELDLSFNNFHDLKSLQPFTRLHTIILDHNLISGRTTFPILKTLEILWINHNQVTNLCTFIDKVSHAYPNLKYLSMIDNNAAPSFYNKGTYESHADYRYFVINSLPKLKILDGITVSEKERKKAMEIYGKRKTMKYTTHTI